MNRLFKEYLKEADENPANIILSVSELVRKDADSEDEVAKTSIPYFLMLLKNAGLPISYAGLKSYYNAHPELKNVIQTFNDSEIVFVGQGDEKDGESLGEPQGEVPPEEVVDKMAKRAMKAREQVELDEVSPNKPKSDVIVMKKGQVEKSVVGASAVKKAEKEGFKIQYALLKTGKKVTDPKGIMKAIKSADKLGIGEEVDLDEASKFSNADFILGFAVPWAKNPTTQYEPHLVNYVKKLAPSGNREYAYKMVAQVVQQLINGGMPAIRQWLQQNKGYYDKMDSKVKKELMKGMKEEVDLDEDEYAALDSFTNSVDLTPEEEAKIAAGPDAYEADEKLMAKLMNHFSDGMPYGTQKGRDGDPYEFIFQELDMMGLIKESVEEAAFGGTIDKMQHIVDTKSAMEINGVMVDTFTASLIMDIFSKVNKDNQDKMRKMPVEKLASAAYKLANRFKEDVEEGYYVMPPMDRERYTDLPGLEGPFQTRSGKVVYYDPKEGKYYDRDSDMYLSYDEFKDYDQSRPEDFKMTVKMPKAMQKEDKFDYWQSPNSLAKLAGIKERSLTKAEKKR